MEEIVFQRIYYIQSHILNFMYMELNFQASQRPGSVCNPGIKDSCSCCATASFRDYRAVAGFKQSICGS